MVGVPESPVPAVSRDAENTLLSVSRFARLILCRNLQIPDFSEMRRKITLSSEPTDGCTASLIGSDIFQRHIFILILDVDESRVWLVERCRDESPGRTGELGFRLLPNWRRRELRPCRSPRAAGMGTFSIKTQPQGARSPPTSTCSI
jgi:hypothetical protein